MRFVNMEEAKTNLPRLIAQAINDGTGFLITKVGRP
ncbi:type II toxin-antitoxin system Phd/YefM family antitoxin [Fluviispira vulneris]|nr:type II toxin-antitoxin system Phd/YefM family antitoxin [Fluviispira vulneris]